MFSARAPALRANRLAGALARLRSAGRRIDDLTASNPTRLGLPYARDLLAPLAAPDALACEAAPFGLPAAREAVSAHLAERGAPARPDRVVLTASTSEAYSLLFKLLCDPGDAVLAPQPSYPLFEHLARLDAVEARAYRLEFHGRWEVDIDGLARLVDDRTRAVLLVSPNNPTGSFVRRHELDAIHETAARHGLAIICDEVFAGYPMDEAAARAGAPAAGGAALTFTLGGLSKSAGLPQLKLAWMLAGGPDGLVARALDRLELICDTYLSVAAPVQLAAGALLERSRPVAAAILDRVRGNDAALRRLAGRFPACRVLPVEGGWYAVVQAPAFRSEEDLVLELLRRDGILVHPGYFFDFPREAFLVLSLLPPPAAFARAAAQVLARASRPG